MSDVDATTAVLLALASAAVLVALHLLAPRIRRLPLVPEQVTASFAGGIAVSYVFLHLLPELADGNERIGELLDDTGTRTPLLGLEIFVVALLGFLVFYGLERLAERHQEHVESPGEHGPAQRDEQPVQGTGEASVFRLHLTSFVVYNAVIGYTLPLNWRASGAFAVLFTVAMGLHFVLSDRGLEERYGARFDRPQPRLVLASGLIVGWALAALFAPTSDVFVSLLTAFLAGSILLNVFKEEIPPTRRSHFGWFAVGLASYALLLGGVTALQDEGEESGASTHASVLLNVAMLGPSG
jgi:zinc transporter ZupT